VEELDFFFERIQENPESLVNNFDGLIRVENAYERIKMST